MRQYVAAIVLGLLGWSSPSAGQTLEQIKLFQGFLRDATVTEQSYISGGVNFNFYEFFDSMGLVAQGGYPLNENVELAARASWTRMSFDGGIASRSGLDDTEVVARYLKPRGKTQVVYGGAVVLPTGSDEVGSGQLDFGGFAALRHPLQNGMVAVGAIGLDLVEVVTGPQGEERQASLWLSGGAIYPQSEQTHLVGELGIVTKFDYVLLSGGVDRRLKGGGRLRGMVGLGLDDGAPDLVLGATYLRDI